MLPRRAFLWLLALRPSGARMDGQVCSETPKRTNDSWGGGAALAARSGGLHGLPTGGGYSTSGRERGRWPSHRGAQAGDARGGDRSGQRVRGVREQQEPVRGPGELPSGRRATVGVSRCQLRRRPFPAGVQFHSRSAEGASGDAPGNQAGGKDFGRRLGLWRRDADAARVLGCRGPHERGRKGRPEAYAALPGG